MPDISGEINGTFHSVGDVLLRAQHSAEQEEWRGAFIIGVKPDSGLSILLSTYDTHALVGILHIAARMVDQLAVGPPQHLEKGL